MHRNFVFRVFLLLSLGVFLHSGVLFAQASNSGTISGVVKDPSGAVVAGAAVTIHNPVSGYDRSTTSDSTGSFTFSNIPLNPYHLSVQAAGFGAYAQDVDVRSSVPVPVNIALTVAGSSSTVTVEGGGDLLENEPTFHTDVDRALFDKLPLESQSSSLSSLVTLSTPGIATDLATMRRIRFPLTASPSPISRAKCFRISFPWMRSSHWKLSPGRRRPNS